MDAVKVKTYGYLVTANKTYRILSPKFTKSYLFGNTLRVRYTVTCGNDRPIKHSGQIDEQIYPAQFTLLVFPGSFAIEDRDTDKEILIEVKEDAINELLTLAEAEDGNNTNLS